MFNDLFDDFSSRRTFSKLFLGCWNVLQREYGLRLEIPLDLTPVLEVCNFIQDINKEKKQEIIRRIPRIFPRDSDKLVQIYKLNELISQLKEIAEKTKVPEGNQPMSAEEFQDFLNLIQEIAGESKGYYLESSSESSSDPIPLDVWNISLETLVEQTRELKEKYNQAVLPILNQEIKEGNWQIIKAILRRRNLLSNFSEVLSLNLDKLRRQEPLDFKLEFGSVKVGKAVLREGGFNYVDE